MAIDKMTIANSKTEKYISFYIFNVQAIKYDQ